MKINILKEWSSTLVMLQEPYLYKTDQKSTSNSTYGYLLGWCAYCSGVNSFSVILSSAMSFASISPPVSGSPSSSTRFKVELREGPNSSYNYILYLILWKLPNLMAFIFWGGSLHVFTCYATQKVY